MTPDARREAAINRGLAKRLEQMADERARAARAAAAADEEFSAEFLNAAREVFIMSARGVRPSTSNLCASRSARTPSTRLVAHRPAPAQDRQGRLRVARPRGDRRVQRPFSAPARPFRLHRAAKAPSGWRRVDGAAVVTRRRAATFDLRTGQVCACGQKSHRLPHELRE